MKLGSVLRWGAPALTAGLMMAVAAYAQDAAAPAAEAAAPAAPTPNKGDTVWMLLSTVLVLLMTVPGLALFYGGLVRTKNMLSVLMQVFVITSLVMVIWLVYGYSLAFTDGGSLNSFVGGFSKAFLSGVDVTTTVESFSRGVVIPEIVFVCFQMTFAAITPALIVGAFAERIKFSALLLFTVLWVTFIYFPMAHMVWWWPGPEFAATNPAEATVAGAGLIWSFGAIDFAGGTVVHINAGITALVGALVLGPRIGFGKEAMPPHSLTLTLVGASLLWVGWFGFNAGSNLEANGYAALAMLNTFAATAAAVLGWMFVEWMTKGHPSLLGAVSGAIAGLVAVTPAAGFAGPMGSLVLGAAAGIICFIACTSVKNALGYDDSLDVFGVHCVGGIVGAIATGILVNPALGGAGIVDYTLDNGAGTAGAYVFGAQIIAQLKGVGVTILWSGIGSFIIYKIVDLIVGLRVTQEKEREGLDVTEHGERAYNM
ncbi:ammonium transporter [Methylopila turkensis]|uniref:Ammonium transporter n=1 Tax=Methylopila turkensis TaxID=1437816 RepID=A0A9W6JT85_9HYPH|nr:ammonium transporter [Methylopila turkensis]GLK81884.1 ammonium transporter [Methylopila turkensis]